MVVHAALAVLLARLSATDDIAVATPIAGRGQKALDPLIGMFVNTLVLRANVDLGMSYTELLDDVRSTDLEAFAHADVPFETVVEQVDPVRSRAFSPLAQVMLTLTQPSAGAPVFDGAGVEMSPLEPLALAAQFDLSISVAVVPGQAWTGTVIYAADLFDPTTITTLTDRFVNMIGELTASPDVAVGDAPLVSPAELERIVAWSSGSPQPPAASPTLANLIIRRFGSGRGDD
jgi:non-ribosomal peptide synthetase component F